MAVLFPEPDSPLTTTTSRPGVTGPPPAGSELLILLADEAEERGAVGGGEQAFAEGAVLEQARHPRQRLEVLSHRILGRDEEEEEMGGAAVERLEVDAGGVAAERPDDAG